MPYRTILVGIDGSEDSVQALIRAGVIADRFSARLVAVWVTPSKPSAGFDFLTEEQLDGMEHEADEILETLKADLGIDFEKVVAEGDPGDVLLSLAHSKQADLIVVGRRGTSPTIRWVLGSVVTKLVQHAPCAVLVTDASSASPAPLTEKVICAVDGSPESRAAASAAVEMTAAFGGSIRLAHAEEFSGAEGISPLAGQLTGKMGNIIESEEEEMSYEARKLGVPYQIVHLSQPPATSILHHADEWRATLISAGSRGRSPLGSLILGSTSLSLLQRAECSVLIYPRLAIEGKAVA